MGAPVGVPGGWRTGQGPVPKPPSSWSTPSQPPSVPLEALPGTQSPSPCKLRGFSIYRNPGPEVMSGHTGAPSLHTLGFQGPAGVELEDSAMPGALLGRGRRFAVLLGQQILFGKMSAILPGVAHPAVLDSERLEGPPPAYSGGTDALISLDNPRKKPSAESGQRTWAAIPCSREQGKLIAHLCLGFRTKNLLESLLRVSERQ